MNKVLMVFPSFTAKGGITSVVNGYKNKLNNEDYSIKYIETYCDGSKIKKVFVFVLAYIKFIFYLLFWNPKIIHIHSSFNASFTRKSIMIKTAAFLKKKIINHVHGANFSDFYENAPKNKKDKIKKVYNKCDKIIALSKEWELNLAKIVSKDKIEIIENFGIVSVDKARKKRNNVVLFLGFICERKGCFDIPMIIKKVNETNPNIKFIIAGSGNQEDEKKFKKCIEQCEVEKNVVLPGWINGKEKDELLRKADLFLLPSYNEGMPMAILDSMGYALPVVSTNVGGISKIVKNNINGYIFQPGDIDGFSKAIINIIENDDLRIKYGNNSISIIKNGYSLDEHISKIRRLYMNLLNL